MQHYKNRLRRLLLTGMILIFTIPVFSQQSRLNQRRLTRDLNIMEGVLDKLLQGETHSRYRLFDGHSRGVYLPGFGILFHTQQEGPVIHELNVALQRQYEAVQEKAAKVREEMDDKRDEMRTAKEMAEEAFLLATRDKDKRIEELEELSVVDELATESKQRRQEEARNIEMYKDQIFIFFKNYTAAIGQLSPENRLAVLVNLKGWDISEDKNTYLTAWVKKEDVDRFRQKQISAEELKNRTHFQLTTDKKEIDTDISILTEILERGMSSTTWYGSGNSGIYINGLGAIVFVEVPNVFRTARVGFGEGISVIVNDSDAGAYTYVPSTGSVSKSDKKDDKSFEERMNEVETELFDLIASYGHTLRIESNESIILNVKLGSRIFTTWGRNKEKHPSNLILQLKKKDLDDYNSGSIDLSSLKQRLVKQTY